MPYLIAGYLFCGATYAAWTWKSQPDRSFNAFKDYFKFVFLITFLWPLFAAKDIIIGLYHFVFGKSVEIGNQE